MASLEKKSNQFTKRKTQGFGSGNFAEGGPGYLANFP